jgi:hypothetical protein
MLTAVGEGEALGSAAAWMAADLNQRDDLFPDVLPAVEYALADQERVHADSA